jgi:predicted permease
VTFFQWLKRRREIDQDIAEEIRSHLAMAARDHAADGADPETARRAAVKEFGNVALALEDSRRAWTSRWVEATADVLKDIRYAVHVLAKSPGFSLVVIGVLALGIGMNAVVFTLLKDLALKPLPGVEGSGRLAVVMSKTKGGRIAGVSYPDYVALRDQGPFAGVAGSSPGLLNLGLKRQGERLWGELVTGNYFQFMGVHAQLGRTLLPSDETAPGKDPVAVLSNGLWRRAFGADPNIIGKTIHVNAYPLTVVGVADKSFHGSVVSWDVEVFVPIMMAPQLGVAFQNRPGKLLHDRKAGFLAAYSRLRPGGTLERASAQTAVLSKQLAADQPLEDVDRTLTVLPISRAPWGAQTYMLPAITMCGAMGILLLLIVCANLSGLVLVRGISRRGEIAARLALGASRIRILRLLLIENAVLVAPGAAAGLVLASFALPWMNTTASAKALGRFFFDISVDRMVVGFVALAACLSLLFFGLLPALRSSKVDLASVMKDSLSARGAAKGRFRSALVVAQVGISLLLLVSSGLVWRSLDAAQRLDRGFDDRGVISVTVDLKPNGYDEARGRVFYQQLLDQVRGAQGVESASLAATYPMTMVDSEAQRVEIEGYRVRRDEDQMFLYNVVTSDYFRTLRIGIEAGREFTPHDDASGSQVAVVNETLARRFWGTPRGAIGKRLRAGSGEWRTVVGVVRDVKYARINEAPRPYVYLPFFQAPRSSMIVHARGSAGAVALLEQARREVHRLDPDLPILDARTLHEQTSLALSILTMTARILATLGFMAMALASMGIYGLVSYSAKQSTHEIGIRMALGATRSDVVRRFLARGVWLGVIGAALGMGASYAVTRFLAAQLYGVSATDPASFATAMAFVLGSTAAAAVAPAWRAARTDPMTALRYQ